MAQVQRNAPDASASADTLKGELNQLASSVQQLAADQIGALQHQASAKVNDLEAAIRRNPTQAAAIAAGIGFAIGLILRR